MRKKYWANRLTEVAWEYNTIWNTTIGFKPCELVYGKKGMMSTKFELVSLRIASHLDVDLLDAQEERRQRLNALYKNRLQALFHNEIVQLQRKILNDKCIKLGNFKEGDWKLLYDSKFKDFKGKFMTRVWTIHC